MRLLARLLAEHEVRESFTWNGFSVFGPHIPLAELAASTAADPDARA